jgi:hypothetical protein
MKKNKNDIKTRSKRDQHTDKTMIYVRENAQVKSYLFATLWQTQAL